MERFYIMDAYDLHKTHCIAGMILLALPTSNTNANLLTNPGFENTGISGWHLSAPDPQNFAEIVSDTSHSGLYSVKLTANVTEAKGRSVQVYSDTVPVPGGALIEASTWIKANSIDRCGSPDIDGCQNWHQLRVTLYAYDSSNALIKPHWDILSTDGDVCATGNNDDCDWKNIRFSLITPNNTASMRIAVSITTSTGTAWIDDVELKVLETIPELDFSEQTNPIIIPPPKKMTKGNDHTPLGSVAVITLPGDDRLRDQVRDYLEGNSIAYAFDPADSSQFTTELVIGNDEDTGISTLFSQRFPDHDWQELGDEGYFISVGSLSPQRVTIGANSERGRFYGVQTAKQLIMDQKLYIADILDTPTNDRRGIVLGMPWFSNNAGATAVDRLASRKGNLVWVQGGHMNGVLSWNWRQPFNQDQLSLMHNLHSSTTRNYVDTYISFGPRTLRTTAGCHFLEHPSPRFSDPQEADILATKILTMYDIGYRHFGINFDDVDICGEDVLRYEEDIDQFSNSIAMAHVHFVNEVYLRLMATHDDISFAMVPLWYTRTGNSSVVREEYVASLKELNSNIELVTVQVTDDNISTFEQLTSRPTLLWSNYFAELKGTIYTLPYISEFTWDPGNITGFLFLPAMPDTDIWNEDQSLVSWNSALSYAWSPHRYDPYSVFYLSGARYEGALDPVPAVSLPIISPSSGVLRTDESITLSTTTPGTSIYYTLDGTIPSNRRGTRSILYQAPFTLSEPKTLMVRAFRDGFLDSQIATSSFTYDSDTIPTTDSIWFDDAFPVGATQYGNWEFSSTSITPYSGITALQSNLENGMHQHYFINATNKMTIGENDTILAYVYLDPDNKPSQIMLQWYHGGSWNHRAYWGENNIDWGIDGTESRQHMGPMPAAGYWVRLEIPASAVGLNGKTIGGMAFTLYNGRAAWDYVGISNIADYNTPVSSDVVWMEDAVPAGALQAGTWNFVSNDPTPFSGDLSHESVLSSGIHQHYFYNANERLSVNANEVLIAYVYLDPFNPPSEIMLQWRSGTSWEHRAYWGEDKISWGADGTNSRRYMGDLPGFGKWIRLEVPAHLVGLENKEINGIAFTLFDGSAYWDYVGKMQ